MPQCKVKYCTVTRGRGFSTFAIPDPKKEYERCALWLKNIGNPKLDIQTYEYSKEKVVCEKHFESRYFKEDIRVNCFHLLLKCLMRLVHIYMYIEILFVLTASIERIIW